MSTSELFIDSSPRVVPDKNGHGVIDGESFELVITAGPHCFRTARFFGDANLQKQKLSEVQKHIGNIEVKIKND